MEHGDGEQRLGCPACRFVGRTCPPSCPLSMHFPAETESDFTRIKALRNVFDELRAYPTAQPRFTKAEALVSEEARFSGTGRRLLVEAMVEASFGPRGSLDSRADETRDRINDYSYDADIDFSEVNGIESLALNESLDDDQDIRDPSGPACASCERRGRRESLPVYASVEKLLGAETLTRTLKVLSQEDRKLVVESMVHEAKTLADRPAGKFIKAITDNTVSEIERVPKELELYRASKKEKAGEFQDSREETPLEDQEADDQSQGPDQEQTPLEDVLVSEPSPLERAFHAGEKRDLRLVETPSPKHEDYVPRSPLGTAITELHNLIARQEEEELGSCDTESLITHSPRSVS